MLESIPNAYAIGKIVAKALLIMKGLGFDLDKFHVVGHSLGGQLAGIIGREVYAQSGNTYKLKRITALDPAGPFFYGFASLFNKPLSKYDGKIYYTIQ